MFAPEGRVVALREEYSLAGLASGWVSLSAGSRLPCVTAIRFEPPLPGGARAELRVGRVIVALEDAFGLPQALEPRSRPARHVAALAPERVGAFLDNADRAQPLHVRVVGDAGHSGDGGRKLVLEGLNVVVAVEGEGAAQEEPAYADRH